MIELILGIATLVGTGYIAYKSKASEVESEADRLRLLKEQCVGLTFTGELTAIRIENVEFDEKSRGLREWFGEECPGTTTVTFNFRNVQIHPEFFSDFSNYTDTLSGVEVEEVNSWVVGSTTASTWRLETNDPDDIKEFVAGWTGATDSALKEGKSYVQLTAKITGIDH